MEFHLSINGSSEFKLDSEHLYHEHRTQKISGRKSIRKVRSKKSSTKPKECVICLNDPLEIVFIPCGHACSCTSCAEKVSSCPICREELTYK